MHLNIVEPADAHPVLPEPGDTVYVLGLHRLLLPLDVVRVEPNGETVTIVAELPNAALYVQGDTAKPEFKLWAKPTPEPTFYDKDGIPVWIPPEQAA